MKGTRMVWFVATVVLLAGVWFLVGSAVRPERTDDGQHRFAMARPPFAGVAYAEEDSEVLDIGEKLDAEAGISAWYSAGMPIDLNLVRDLFATIETETMEYIIGSIEVPGLEDFGEFDVHAYVHVEGWILVYYLNSNETAKVADVKAETIATTKFSTVIALITGAVGAPFTGETYYDFRYPNATHLLFVAEHVANGGEFTIFMPMSFSYSDRGWAKYGDCNFWVDGEHLPSEWTGGSMCYGDITPDILNPGVTHEIHTGNIYGVLVVTYRVP